MEQCWDWPGGWGWLPSLCPEKKGDGEFSPQPELPRAGGELSATLRIGVTLAGRVLRHSAPCPPDLANAQNHGAAGPEPRG